MLALLLEDLGADRNPLNGMGLGMGFQKGTM